MGSSGWHILGIICLAQPASTTFVFPRRSPTRSLITSCGFKSVDLWPPPTVVWSRLLAFLVEPVDKILKEPHDSVPGSECTITNNRPGVCALDRCPLLLLAGVELDGNGRRCGTSLTIKPVIRPPSRSIFLRLAFCSSPLKDVLCNHIMP